MTPTAAAQALQAAIDRRRAMPPEQHALERSLIRFVSAKRNAAWANPHSEITVNPTGKGAK